MILSAYRVDVPDTLPPVITLKSERPTALQMTKYRLKICSQ